MTVTAKRVPPKPVVVLDDVHLEMDLATAEVLKGLLAIVVSGGKRHGETLHRLYNALDDVTVKDARVMISKTDVSDWYIKVLS